MATEPVRFDLGAPVARLVLDRPDRRNALSLDVMQRMIDALDAVAVDPAAVVVLSGEGPAFSAGHDLTEMVETRREGFHDKLFTTCVTLMNRLHDIPQPVIAKVHGVATAAGCQLVAAADLAVASAEHACFATPGVNIGLFCSTPMVPVSRTIGRKRALEMLLTGDLIDAATAHEWGLVNRVVPAEELDAETDALADRIIQASPYVVALGKRAFYAQESCDERQAYALACSVMTENAQAPDAVEGMRAFLEKRAPVWRGRIDD